MSLKNLSWQQWTAFGLIIALIITAVVLHLVQPEVSFAFTEIASVVTFFVGVVVGYLLGKKKCVCTKKQLLTD